MTDASQQTELMHQMAVLCAEIRALRTELAEVRRPTRGNRLSEDDRKVMASLLPHLTVALNVPITVADLRTHFIFEDVRTEIDEAVGALSPRSIGKLFGRAAGHPIGGLVVSRASKREGAGNLWCVCVFGTPQVKRTSAR